MQQCQFNLVREEPEMTGEPVKQLALVAIRCMIPDQNAFRCVFPELFDLRELILHHRPSSGVPKFQSRNSGSQFGLGIRA